MDGAVRAVYFCTSARVPMGADHSSLGKYRIIAELGHGGMADVFLAVAGGPAGLGFSKLVVIKRLRPHLAQDQDFIDMLVDEARIAARLNHPNAIQTYEHFSERRQEDGGVRFKGTEDVQDFSYDCWVIDQLSEGVVPLVLPAVLDNLQVVDDSFDYVAAKVAAARAQLSVAPVTYPLSGPTTNKSTPEWFTSPYNTTANLDAGLDIQETGDVAHNQEIDDVP